MLIAPSSSLAALIAFAGLTLFHVLIVISHRTILINTGRAKPNSFQSMRKTDESTFVGRVGCSHANCLENLPLFLTVVIVNQLVVGAPDISVKAWWYVLLKTAQALQHCTSVREGAVVRRFICYMTSTVLLVSMAYQTVMG